MARPSRWQQFANNFNAVYGTFNDAFQNIESTRVMRQEFTDDAGNPMTGSALDRARYSALADIRTKYGDAAGGLALRANQAALESNTFNNDLNAATRDQQTYLRGDGAVAGLNSEINSRNASAAASMASANRTNTLLPGEVESQGLTNRGLLISNDTAALGLDTSRRTQDADIDRARADAAKAIADADVATGTVDSRIATDNAGARNADATATINETTAAEAVAVSPERINATLEELRAAAAEASNRRVTVEGAARDNSVVSDIMGQALEMDFDTPEAANSWIIENLAGADISPQARLNAAETVNKFGIEVLGTRAADLTRRAEDAFRTGGLGGVADLYDNVNDGVDGRVVRDGDTVSIVIDRGDGLEEVVASATGPDAETIVATQAMEIFRSPMQAMQMAAAELEFETSRANIDNTAARTALIDQQTFTETLNQNTEQARTALVQAQTDKIRQEIEQAEGGLSAEREIALRGLSGMLSDPNFIMLQDQDPEMALRAQLDYMQAFGLVQPEGGGPSGTPPDGIDQPTWDAMSDEDKLLFQ